MKQGSYEGQPPVLAHQLCEFIESQNAAQVGQIGDRDCDKRFCDTPAIWAQNRDQARETPSKRPFLLKFLARGGCMDEVQRVPSRETLRERGGRGVGVEDGEEEGSRGVVIRTDGSSEGNGEEKSFEGGECGDESRYRAGLMVEDVHCWALMIDEDENASLRHRSEF